MRKLFLLFIGLISINLFVSCEKVIPASKLPQKAQDFIQLHFQDTDVLSVKKDGLKYDVILMNGVDLDFNHSGNWTDVDCQNMPVPVAIIPVAIQNYVTAHFPDCFIVKIAIDRHKYEIELNNDVDAKFDKDGNFLYID